MPLLALCCLAAGLLASPAVAEGRTFPQVTALQPNNGPQAGASTVTIDGVAFDGRSPVRSVEFGAKPALSFKVESETEIAAVAPPGSGEAEVRLTNEQGESSPAVAAARYAYDPPPAEPWLGLNGNSSQSLGPLDTFLEHGLYYDRSGGVEWTAGETLAQSGGGLAASIAAGMIPIVTIEYSGYPSCHFGEQCLPRSAAAISEYVSGFISSAREILARYPAAPILLEASNEPWQYGSAAQYAAIVASLLPAAARAHLPLDRIYVGALSSEWITSMYAARPALQSEVKGWYVHPYDLSRGPGAGIAELPAMQATMTSGQSNVIVSEIGFCARDVNEAGERCGSSPAATASAGEAATKLASELRLAIPFHRAGWLRALIVYSRNDGGWAMQLPGGALTPAGAALEAFGDASR